MSKRKGSVARQNRIDVGQFTEGMPCHRYILRNLRDEEDAKTFVKNFVNTMTYIHLPDEYIEADIFLFSRHLPSSSPLKNYPFEKWDSPIEGLPLLDAIRMDGSVATYKKCTQYYRSNAPKTDACCICPLSKWYANAKEKEELSVLRYTLESEENYNYVASLGINSSHFTSLSDLLEVATYAMRPGMYAFYAAVYEALGKPDIHEAHFSLDDKRVMSVAMCNYLSNDIVKRVVPDKYSNPSYVNSVISILWEYIISCELYDKSQIERLVMYIMSEDIVEPNKGNNSVAIGNSIVTTFSDLGASGVEEFYNSFVDVVDVRSGSNRSEKPMIFEPVTIESILSSLSQEVSEQKEEKHTVFDMSNDVPVDNEGLEITTDGFVSDESTLSEPFVDDNISDSIFPDADFGVCEDKVSEADEGRVDSFSTENTSGEIVLRELEVENPKEEIFEEKDSMVSVPFVPQKELLQFAICLDNAAPRLHTIFESHVLKDKRLTVELIETDNGVRCLLLYSPRLHAYFYTGLKDKKVLSIITQLLSYPSICKCCYYPFILASTLVNLGIRVKNLVSLFSVSSVLLGSHRMSMRDVLCELGCTPAIGGVTIKPEGEIESIALLYMHSYISVYHRKLYELKRGGMYANYISRQSFDLVLAEHFHQERFSTNPRSLFVMKDSSNYIFGKPRDEKYKLDGKVFTYKFRNHCKPSILIRELLCIMKEKGYMSKYGVMITCVSKNSFSLYIEKNDIDRVQTSIHTSLLMKLMEREYRGVVYEVREQN